jgi:hypothetical protein
VVVVVVGMVVVVVGMVVVVVGVVVVVVGMVVVDVVVGVVKICLIELLCALPPSPTVLQSAEPKPTSQ